MHAEMFAISRAHAAHSSNKRTSFGRGRAPFQAGLSLHIPGASTLSLSQANATNSCSAGGKPSLRAPPPDHEQRPDFLARTRIDVAQLARHTSPGDKQCQVKPGTATGRHSSRRSPASRGSTTTTTTATTTTPATTTAKAAKAKAAAAAASGSVASEQDSPVGQLGLGPGSALARDGDLARRDAGADKSMQFKVSQDATARSFRTKVWLTTMSFSPQLCCSREYR